MVKAIWRMVIGKIFIRPFILYVFSAGTEGDSIFLQVLEEFHAVAFPVEDEHIAVKFFISP
jgi:hypothetical protein